MEQEVKDKKNDEFSSLSSKKYVTTWRNKWITANASSIDDFIATYERLAELMKRWKSEGIILDPDIFGGVGDDYAQFCTYDEAVALKEGFEEEYYEEDDEDDGLIGEMFQDWEEEPLTLEFSINPYLSLKSDAGRIQIYVNNKPFEQCRYLLIINPSNNEHQHEIASIDEAESLYGNELESSITPEELGITKEQEFWAHCSNLQVWVENDYDSRLLHRNLAFPLLKKLTEVGDLKAKKVFKEEIAQRFARGHVPVMKYLFIERYVDYLSPEEFSTLLDDVNFTDIEVNELLENVGDYSKSKYGEAFLFRIKEEYNEYFTNNWVYVEIKTHKLDKSDYSPIAITPDNKFFIRGSNDGKLKVFDIMTGDLVRLFGDHHDSVFKLAISHEGKLVASSSDNRIKIWDLETGELLLTLEGHEDAVSSLAFDPDGDYLLSGSTTIEVNESAINVWNLKNGKIKISLDSHWEEISSFAFSRDCEYLISGAFDKTVNIWDTKTGRLINTLIGHESGIIDVAITDDNEKVMSASLDNTVKIWDLASGKVIKEIIIDGNEDRRMQCTPISFFLTPDGRFIVG